MESVMTHCATGVTMHSSVSNDQGKQTQLDFADFTPIPSGCYITQPCIWCEQNSQALKLAYYPHDRRVCPMSDMFFARLINDLKVSLGLSTVPAETKKKVVNWGDDRKEGTEPKPDHLVRVKARAQARH
jgi:hypothetical protein